MQIDLSCKTKVPRYIWCKDIHVLLENSLLTLISNNEYFIEQIWIEYFTSITATARAVSERNESLVFSNVAYSSNHSWTLVYRPQDTFIKM